MCDPITLGVLAGSASAAAGVGATTAIGVAGTALVAGGITAGVAGMVDANKQAGRAARMQQAMENRKAQRSQLQALRESQIQRAMIQQRSAVGGSLDSSGFSGAMSSIGSQLGSNIGFSREMSAFGQGILSLQQQASRSQMLSQLGFQAASFGMQGFGGLGGTTTSASAMSAGNNTSSLQASQFAGGAQVG